MLAHPQRASSCSNHTVVRLCLACARWPRLCFAHAHFALYLQYSSSQWHTAIGPYNAAVNRICPLICFAVTGNAAVTLCTSSSYSSPPYQLAFASYGPELCQSNAISARWKNDMPSSNTDSNRGTAAVGANFYGNNQNALKVNCAGWV